MSDTIRRLAVKEWDEEEEEEEEEEECSRFTDNVKCDAVRRARRPCTSKAGIVKNRNQPQVVSPLRTRARRLARGKGETISSDEFERMSREVTNVTTERDILKWAAAYFAIDLI